MQKTDPAREFADTCAKLCAPKKEKGEQVLAELFGVEAWSTPFFDIVAALSRRGDEIVQIIETLDLDDDHRAELISDVRQIQRAFSPAGLQNVWENSVKIYLAPQYIGPIKALSSSIRPRISYPKLSVEEIAELKAVISDLLGWLREHQLHEQDFIRQALIDGLDQFSLRLDRLEWVGWGYTLQSLQEVINAYLTLQRGFPDPAVSPSAEAMLKKAEVTLRTVLDKVDLVKKTFEAGDWVLKALGVMSIVHAPHVIAGLLPHAPAA